jgi:hypothetical protein
VIALSLNIQTATGLIEIGGNVTKEKVIEALGYEPASKAHTEDKTVHVTSAERETWNNKSDFSGAYADLLDAPNITENGSDSMVVADESGNIIMQVDADGISTTNVNAKTIKLNDKDLGERLDELEATSLPNIVDNESDDLTVSDEAGNIIMKVNANGLETTTVTAENVVVNGVDVTTKLDEHKERIDGVSGDLVTHASNMDIHITDDERSIWNSKSDFSGDYKDLTNAPDITENESGEVVYVDISGNIIARIGESGFETTQVIADKVIAGGVDVGNVLPSHIDDDDIHITAAERTSWNAKATTEYVDAKVADLVNSAPETLDTLNELATALGDDPNFATTVATQIGLKADKSALDTHTSNATIHVTAQEKESWNAKSEFSGNYNDLTDAPNIHDDGSGEVVYTDKDSNIIAKIDANGFETTNVTAKTMVVNSRNVEEELDKIAEVANTAKTHAESDHARADATLVERSDTNGNIKINGEETTVYDARKDVFIICVDENGISDKTANDIMTGALTGINVANIIVRQSLGDVDAGGVLIEHYRFYKCTAANLDFAEQSIHLKSSCVQDGIIYDCNINAYYANELVTVEFSTRDYQVEIDNAIAEAKEDAASKDVVVLAEAQKGIDAVQINLDAHMDNHENPHNVTAAQIGLGNVDNTSDTDKPVSTAQQAAIDALKNELSESIVSESKEWIISDEDGNIIAKVDDAGLETTTVTAKAMVVNGVDVETALDNIDSNITNITTGTIVVKEAEHADSADKAGIADEAAHAANADAATKATQDASGNVITDTYETKADASTKLTEAKAYTDTAIEEVKTDASNKDAVVLVEAQKSVNAVQVNLDTHASNTDIHITADERQGWNAKADKSYVEEQVALLVNSAPDKLNTLDELAAALGDDENFAVTVANSLAEKANKTDLDTHAANTNIHVTADERTAWNAKADANYVDEQDNALKAELSETIVSESKEWIISDEDGNIVARVDINGLETTVVTADSVIVNNKNVEVKLDEHENAINILDETVKSHTHDDRYYTESEIDNMVFITVDEIDAICGSSI